MSHSGRKLSNPRFFRAMARAMCGTKSMRVFFGASIFLNTFLLIRVFRSYTANYTLPLPYQPEPRLPLPAVDSRGMNDSLYSRQVIFVGGVPRSGTTLVRAMLDSHPDIRCGEETRVIPRILGMRNRWANSDKERKRLKEAGVDSTLLDQATRAFISNIIIGHGQSAKFLCNKDPMVLTYMRDVLRMYPKAKFVMMIRDGRAVAYSIVSRNVTISGVNNKEYKSAALFWNKIMTRITSDCQALGKQHCLSVHYEKLVRNPREWMTKILKFAEVPWNENVLHHSDFISNGGIHLSKYVF